MTNRNAIKSACSDSDLISKKSHIAVATQEQRSVIRADPPPCAPPAPPRAPPPPAPNYSRRSSKFHFASAFRNVPQDVGASYSQALIVTTKSL